MSDDDKRWYTRVPAISIALVAFLVALTTLINNVREIGGLKDKTPPAPAAATPAAPAVKPEAPKAPSRYSVLLTLEKIEVINDGTSGSTSWSFDVSAGGQDLFELPARDYLDTEESRNVTPRTSDPSMGRVVLVPGQEMLIKISGRSSGLISKTSASGTATLVAERALAPVRVVAADPRDGEFVFHFATVATAQ
ncbi:hypothetical protein LC55x_1711 [Lysobacter capsici]|uniref:hypothetical protein n=1 Tax=Lysobacter capsici TaxID=435897 RepID=UPI000716614C|nr:hypothetical protein [Lysobacter capsici]ALN84998.1 hypothetical protein LC55x_1711 [Lysobacter capsici]ATE71235.1 hypothetical protein CNO08_07620 [Lysobacter capsici]WND82216.1 hypothetical protein RJ610_07605 [Lysobacter capsici]WND87411.1 hypothetical protein RJ609_07605 [Lysobacter capsici]